MELYSQSREEAVQTLGTDPARGLNQRECQRRLEQYGKNGLRPAKRRGLPARFFSQFQDLMVLILLAAAAVSFAVSWVRGDGEYVDSLIILAIVVCNAVIGTVQEVRADRAIQALEKTVLAPCLGHPGGQAPTGGEQPAGPRGNLVVLQAGDLVPADLRLLKSAELKIEESALTGESVPAEKDAEARCPQNAPLGERKNMAFASTGVASGAGVGVVAATGMDTAMGRIAHMLSTSSPRRRPCSSA